MQKETQTAPVHDNDDFDNLSFSLFHLKKTFFKQFSFDWIPQ